MNILFISLGAAMGKKVISFSLMYDQIRTIVIVNTALNVERM